MLGNRYSNADNRISLEKVNWQQFITPLLDGPVYEMQSIRVDDYSDRYTQAYWLNINDRKNHSRCV